MSVEEEKGPTGQWGCPPEEEKQTSGPGWARVGTRQRGLFWDGDGTGKCSWGLGAGHRGGCLGRWTGPFSLQVWSLEHQWAPMGTGRWAWVPATVRVLVLAHAPVLGPLPGMGSPTKCAGEASLRSFSHGAANTSTSGSRHGFKEIKIGDIRHLEERIGKMCLPSNREHEESMAQGATAAVLIRACADTSSSGAEVVVVEGRPETTTETSLCPFASKQKQSKISKQNAFSRQKLPLINKHLPFSGFPGNKSESPEAC